MICEQWGEANYLRKSTPFSKDDFVKITDTFPVRVEISASDLISESLLINNDFYYADTTLETKILLNRLPTSLERICRFPVEKGTYNERINFIAKSAFKTDRRFFLSRDYNSEQAEQMLKYYISKAENRNYDLLICKFKDEIVGFAILEPVSEKASYIYLAAVLPDYQGTGIALSLYYNVCKYYKEMGLSQITGRISVENVSVMNLYSSLNCSFADPLKVYIRDRKNV